MGYCTKLLDFPCDSNYECSRKMLLKWYRFINLPLHAFLFLFLVINLRGEFFLYISYWCVFLTFIYFLSISLSYQTICLRPFSYMLLEGILPLNFSVMILWWALTDLYVSDIALGAVSHHFPIITVIIDYSLSSIVFQRSHYIIPFLILLVWITLVLIPATLKYKVLYTGITFTTYFTYVIFLAFVAIVVGVFEVARMIRVRNCKKRKNSNSLDESKEMKI